MVGNFVGDQDVLGNLSEGTKRWLLEIVIVVTLSKWLIFIP